MRGFGDAIKVGAGIAEQPLAERRGTVKLTHQALTQSNEEAIKHRAIQRLLVMKVVIEKRLVHTSGRGDGIHAGTRQAFLGKLSQRRLKDGVAAGFRLTPGAAPRSSKMIVVLHV